MRRAEDSLAAWRFDVMQLHQTRCAPLPLVGRGWGWGSELLREQRQPTMTPPTCHIDCGTDWIKQLPPPPLTPPHKGEGNRPSVLNPHATISRWDFPSRRADHAFDEIVHFLELR